jgi:hypothetical protein
VDAAVAHLGIKSSIPELEWKAKNKGVQEARVQGGMYQVITGGSGAWTAAWVPAGGKRGQALVGGSARPEAEVKKACWDHHLERTADLALQNAGAGELTGKDTKGPAVARKKGGRR